MRGIDFSSWASLLTTVLGLGLVTLIGIGIRLLVMQTIQQRQQRMNRQINERLRALMAAYKVLGGSFTGTLTVDPTHLRDLRHPAEVDGDEPAPAAEAAGTESDRRRRIRDAVEAALSDIFLLGTEEQVRLAERATRELIAGHPVQTHELVTSLRNYIRKALDLDAIPADLVIPAQGPTRPSGAAARGKGDGGDKGAGQGTGGGGGGMGGGGGGMGGGGMGGGLGGGNTENPDDPNSRR